MDVSDLGGEKSLVTVTSAKSITNGPALRKHLVLGRARRVEHQSGVIGAVHRRTPATCAAGAETLSANNAIKVSSFFHGFRGLNFP